MAELALPVVQAVSRISIPGHVKNTRERRRKPLLGRFRARSRQRDQPDPSLRAFPPGHCAAICRCGIAGLPNDRQPGGGQVARPRSSHHHLDASGHGLLDRQPGRRGHCRADDQSIGPAVDQVRRIGRPISPLLSAWRTITRLMPSTRLAAARSNAMNQGHALGTVERDVGKAVTEAAPAGGPQRNGLESAIGLCLAAGLSRRQGRDGTAAPVHCAGAAPSTDHPARRAGRR